MKHHAVGIIGAGAVGASIALSLIHTNVADVFLNDANEEKCLGEVLDLQDAAFVTGVHVSQATLPEMAASCDIIVITAGAKQLPDEPRTNLMTRNVHIFRSIFKGLGSLRPDTLILVVSNPCDALTFLAQDLSGLPRSQVLGSGTYLDSQRLRVAIAHDIGVSVKSVHAYVLGEHGDSQFAAYGAAKVGGCDLTTFSGMHADHLAIIADTVSHKAYDIIKRKGATSYGIGAIVAHVCDCMLHDKKEVMPLSVYLHEHECCMGWPAVIGRAGCEKVIPLPLTHSENEKLLKSAAKLRDLKLETV
jgi:L-lactate dehydrogenase